MVTLALPATSYASCVPMTAEQQEQRADVIFAGVALEGPTPTGIQRFRVVRYLKGTGAETVGVATGVVVRPDGSGSTTSVSPTVNAGERWRIYARKGSAGDVLETSLCDGSTELASTGEPAGAPTPDSPSDTAAGGRNLKGILLALSLGVFALSSLALGVRRRLRRNSVLSG